MADGWYQLGSAIRKRWFPNQEDLWEEEQKEYQSELRELGRAKTRAEMKGLQSLDKPIYERPAEYDYSDEFAATGVAPGKLVSEEYKSPITNRMMKEWNLSPEELPRRDVEALGLRPRMGREYKPEYITLFNPETKEMKDFPRGGGFPPGWIPAKGIEPYDMMPEETPTEESGGGIIGGIGRLLFGDRGSQPPQEEKTPMLPTGPLPGQIEQGEPTFYVFEVDGKRYNIPARRAEEFIKDKPNARRIK